MNFSLTTAVSLLKRTPTVLNTLLEDLPEELTHSNEGEGTWSPVQVVGHLVINEETNFMVRIQLALSDNANKVFIPIDRNAHLDRFKNNTLSDMLDKFTTARKQNLDLLESHALSPEKLSITGTHPTLGEVTVRQILSTWVIHDLTHIVQIERVIAKQYKVLAGPFIEFLTMLK